MATIQHSSLPSAKVHEPKHITSSTTADAGKVITPSSSVNGASVLRNLEVSEVNGLADAIAQTYGTRTVRENTTTIAKTAAVDSTLRTNTDYTQVTGIFGLVGDEFASDDVVIGTNSITVETTGLYRLGLWLSTTFSVNSTTVAFKFVVNGTSFSSRDARSIIPNTGNVLNVSCFIYRELTAGDIVSIWTATNNTGNLTISDAMLEVRRIV